MKLKYIGATLANGVGDWIINKGLPKCSVFEDCHSRKEGGVADELPKVLGDLGIGLIDGGMQMKISRIRDRGGKHIPEF